MSWQAVLGVMEIAPITEDFWVSSDVGVIRMTWVTQVITGAPRALDLGSACYSHWSCCKATC